MKYLQTFFLSLIAIMMAAGLCACGGDDNEPEQPEITDPTEEVDDPAGTITLSMRNDNNGGTRLGRFYIDDGDNFTNGYFTSIGSVNGLGNVSYIPKTGWASKIAVTPGCGYVAYNEYDDTYYRIYVTDYIIGSTSYGIIGAYVKYQTPFHGADADISLSTDNLVFDETGGEQAVEITNTTIIPFTVESDADWCHVARATTLDQNFLYNAIDVWVEPSDSNEPTTANVTITALNGKTKTFTVTRSGTKPYISCSPTTLTVGPTASSGPVSIYSNIENVNDIVATSNVNWLKVGSLTKSIVTSPTLKSIEGRDISSIKATSNQYYYILPVDVAENMGSERTGVITLSAPNAESATFTLTQEGVSLTLSHSEYTASAASGSYDFRITTTIPAEKLSVSSSATWLESSIVEDGQNKYLRAKWDANVSEQERNATITVKTEEVSAELNVIQNGISLNISKTQLYFDRNASSQTITINCDVEYNLVSPEDWCTFSANGSSVTIRVAEATVDRTIVLTFNGMDTDKAIEINQSKYAVNDEYNENGITGTVKYMSTDGTRIIIKDLETTAAWSTENVLIGASDRYDGQNNMAVVKAIPNWEKLYPAFALVDALNVDGVTGWYLPACQELHYCKLTNTQINIWSSTEYNADRARANYKYYDSYNNCINKSISKSVYAAHRF